MPELNPKRVNAITIRFDDSEWHDASTGAAACDRSLSDFIRLCVRRYCRGILAPTGPAVHAINRTESHPQRDFEPSGFGPGMGVGEQR